MPLVVLKIWLAAVAVLSMTGAACFAGGIAVTRSQAVWMWALTDCQSRPDLRSSHSFRSTLSCSVNCLSP